MSTPSTSSPVSRVPARDFNLIDSLLSGFKWGGAVGTGVNVTYSFPWTSAGTATYSGADGSAYSKLDEPNGTQHFGLNAVQRAAAAA
ncbi:MAG: hypothetical protein ABIQ08_03210, partial [Duganella sp.]